MKRVAQRNRLSKCHFSRHHSNLKNPLKSFEQLLTWFVLHDCRNRGLPDPSRHVKACKMFYNFYFSLSRHCIMFTFQIVHRLHLVLILLKASTIHIYIAYKGNTNNNNVNASNNANTNNNVSGNNNNNNQNNKND